MPLTIIRDDITKVRCDAIVNAAKNSLLGGGGVDGAIHRAAGPELLEECRTLGGCETGDAKITKAYALPAKYVIHTVGPVWRGGDHGERELLRSCYRRSLELAAEYGCETVAFPLISAGVFGYPKDQALRVAADAITEFLLDHDMTVTIVVFNRDAYLIGKKLYADIKSHIDDAYAEQHHDERRDRLGAESLPLMNSAPSDYSDRPKASKPKPVFGKLREKRKTEPEESECDYSYSVMPGAFGAAAPAAPAAAPEDDEALRSRIRAMDESFSQMLLRKIDEKGMTDAQCYKKANIDRKLFSKIRGDIHYKPSKPTALAFILALELPPDEAKDMLRKAGYALSRSNEFDIIVEYFIERRNYNVFEINEALFAFDQPLLGA